MKKYRILQINGRSDLSGGPISMLRLVQNLDPDKFEHFILCPYEENGIIDELKMCSNCTIIPMKFRSIRNVRNFSKIYRVVKDQKFDLIHSHGKAAGVYSRIIGKITNTPVAHHLHGIHYKQYFKPVQYAYWKIEALLSNWSDRIICVSNSEREEGLSLSMFSPDKSVVIHNGVDIDQFKHQTELKSRLRKRWNIPDDAKVIVSITRSCFQKNPELSLKIHSQILKKHPKAYLFLIGIAPDYNKINKLAKKLDIQNNIVLTDNERDIDQVLNIGDLYLSTSRWEGLSIGLIEAMATELPVVLSEVVGNKEFLNGEEDGAFFVKNESTSEYIKKIDRLLQSETFSINAGKVARSKIIKDFNLFESVKKVENEYLSLMH